MFVTGFKQLKQCEPGQLIRMSGGDYILLSEYSGEDGLLNGYIAGGGEHFATRDPNEWVAIINLEEIESNIEHGELGYPPQPRKD